MDSVKYAKAYTEVMEIISYFSEEEYAKIPKEKIEFYKNNMDKEYDFKINPEVELSEQNISKEAKTILITIFRDYFATDRQKEILNNLLEQNQNKLEQIKQEKYNYEEIFKNKKDIAEESKEENTSLIEYKESFFTRFKKFILHLLNK